MPEPVPPEMRIDARAVTACPSTLAIGRAQCAVRHQRLQFERAFRKLADGDERAVDGNGPHGYVDTRAVEQPGIDHGRGFVDATADCADDLIDDAQNVRLILEADRSRFQLPTTFDVDELMGVDQNVGDRWVLQDWFDRAQANQFIQDLVDEVTQLTRIERETLRHNIVRNHPVNLVPQLRSRDLLDVRQVKLVDQPTVQPHLRVDQFRGLQETACAGRGVALGRRHAGGRWPVNFLRVPVWAVCR